MQVANVKHLWDEMENSILSQCSHCHKAINLTPDQDKKLRNAYDLLQPGKVMSIGCPHCKQSIAIKKEEDLQGNAFDAFPDLMADLAGDEPDQKADEPVVETSYEKQDALDSTLTPPGPPDISWLKTGDLGELLHTQELSLALVLLPAGEDKEKVSQAFVDLGYRVESAESAHEAIEKMKFVTFSAIVLHVDFEGGTLEKSQCHDYIKWLPMSKRRSLYYVVIGPDFHTSYDLAALSVSANMVINGRDIRHISRILRKGFRDYDSLFGPFLSALEAHGKH